VLKLIVVCVRMERVVKKRSELKGNVYYLNGCGSNHLNTAHYVFLEFITFHFCRTILQRETSKILARINNSNKIYFL
jgi:hypothetical protein